MFLVIDNFWLDVKLDKIYGPQYNNVSVLLVLPKSHVSLAFFQSLPNAPPKDSKNSLFIGKNEVYSKNVWKNGHGAFNSYSIVGAGCEINELLLGGGYLKPDGSIEDKIYHTGVTIQSGATVNVLDLSKLNTFANVKIEDGAVVKKFRYNEVEYATFDEAKAALQANNQ